MSDLHARIATRLWGLRVERLMGLIEAAEGMGISYKTLSAYETGRRGVPLDRLGAVLSRYGVKLSEFFAEVESERVI